MRVTNLCPSKNCFVCSLEIRPVMLNKVQRTLECHISWKFDSNLEFIPGAMLLRPEVKLCKALIDSCRVYFIWFCRYRWWHSLEIPIQKDPLLSTFSRICIQEMFLSLKKKIIYFLFCMSIKKLYNQNMHWSDS